MREEYLKINNSFVENKMDNYSLTLDEIKLLARCLDEPDIKFLIETYDRDIDNIARFIVHVCCQKGDVSALRYLFETRNMNFDLENDSLPLIYACQFNHNHVFRYLISRGADAMTQYLAYMIMACFSGSIDIISYYCIDNGIDVCIENNVLLISAAMNFQTDLVEFLILLGADPYIHDNIILRRACQNNYLDLLLLFQKLNLRFDGILLSCAALAGNRDALKILMDSGVDPRHNQNLAFVSSIEMNQVHSLEFLFFYFEDKMAFPLV